MAAKKLRSDFLSWDGFSSSGPPDKGWGWWIRKFSQEKTGGWVDKCEQKEEEASDVLGRMTLAPFLRGVVETRTLELPHGRKELHHIVMSSVQSLGCVHLFATPWTAARQASLSITHSWSLLRLMSIESVMHPTISSSVCPKWMRVTRKGGELG